MVYIDTSVLAAYYCPESLSAKVQAALGAVDDPAISALVEVELHSAVSQKVRTGELDPVMANRIVSQFRVHLSDGYFRMVPIEAREYALARDWLARFTTPLRTLDALHLAAAFASGLEVLTADARLARAARELGVRSRLIGGR